MSAEDAEVTEEDRRIGREHEVSAWGNSFWDAVQRFTMSCGGDPSEHVYGNTERQHAVAELGRLRDQLVANARRDAYRAGQIAGLEEAMELVLEDTHEGEDGFRVHGDVGALEGTIDARIRELKGETR